MKTLLFLLALLLLPAVAGFAQSGSEREVSAVVRQWAASIVSRDMTVLENILADEILITDHTGATRGKKEELEALKPAPGVKTISVENEDLKIKMYGKTAVVTALTKMLFDIGGKETITALRYTAIFIKRGRRWQIINLQTTRVPGQNRGFSPPPAGGVGVQGRVDGRRLGFCQYPAASGFLSVPPARAGG